MNRTRDWRRAQRERIRRRRRNFDTVRWAWDAGNSRMVAIMTEHPACQCRQCQYLQRRRYFGPSFQERRAAGAGGL